MLKFKLTQVEQKYTSKNKNISLNSANFFGIIYSKVWTTSSFRAISCLVKREPKLKNLKNILLIPIDFKFKLVLCSKIFIYWQCK